MVNIILLVGLVLGKMLNLFLFWTLVLSVELTCRWMARSRCMLVLGLRECWTTLSDHTGYSEELSELSPAIQSYDYTEWHHFHRLNPTGCNDFITVHVNQMFLNICKSLTHIYYDTMMWVVSHLTTNIVRWCDRYVILLYEGPFKLQINVCGGWVKCNICMKLFVM